jgi:hypothetical protein
MTPDGGRNQAVIDLLTLLTRPLQRWISCASIPFAIARGNVELYLNNQFKCPR